MNEEHFAEVEKTLLYVSEARDRASRSAKALGKSGAEQHLVDALNKAECELDELHTRLMQGTYFAVPKDDQLAIQTA